MPDKPPARGRLVAAFVAGAAVAGGGASAIAQSSSYGPAEADMLVVDFTTCSKGKCPATYRTARQPSEQGRVEGVTDPLRANATIVVDEKAVRALLPSE